MWVPSIDIRHLYRLSHLTRPNTFQTSPPPTILANCEPFLYSNPTLQGSTLPGGIAGLSRHLSLLITREVCFPRQVGIHRKSTWPTRSLWEELKSRTRGHKSSPRREPPPHWEVGKPGELGVLKWVLYTPGDGQKPGGDSAESLDQACFSSGHSWPSSL